MSSFFIWDEALFSLSIPNMDQEHMKIIECMNSLFQANQNKLSKNEIIKVTDELDEIVQIHFQHEEAYMEKISYPGLPNHRSIHQRLLAQLKQQRKEFEENSTSIVSDHFFDFLALWLTAHIQHFDKQYSQWAKVKKESPAQD